MLASTSTIQADVRLELLKSKIRLAIDAAGEERAADLQYIEVQTKPRRAVYATEQFTKGELKLVATSTNIGFAASADTIPSSSFPLGKFTVSEKQLLGYVSAGKHVYPSGGTDEFSLVPFWFVGDTADPTKANVELSEVACEVTASVKRAEGQSMTVKVPIWINTKVIHPNDEIIYFKAEKRVERESLKPPPPAAFTKREAEGVPPVANKRARPGATAAGAANAPAIAAVPSATPAKAKAPPKKGAKKKVP